MTNKLSECVELKMSASEMARSIVIDAGGGFDPQTESMATVIRRAANNLKPRNATERGRIRAAAYGEAGDKILNWLRNKDAERQSRRHEAIAGGIAESIARLETLIDRLDRSPDAFLRRQADPLRIDRDRLRNAALRMGGID